MIYALLVLVVRHNGISSKYCNMQSEIIGQLNSITGTKMITLPFSLED